MVVSDDGPGIPAEELPHVFERFHRGREERATTSGAGLGLSIARELTEMMGGSITRRVAGGGGARFTVRLPRAPGGAPRRRSTILNHAPGVHEAQHVLRSSLTPERTVIPSGIAETAPGCGGAALRPATDLENEGKQ